RCGSQAAAEAHPTGERSRRAGTLRGRRERSGGRAPPGSGSIRQPASLRRQRRFRDRRGGSSNDTFCSIDRGLSAKGSPVGPIVTTGARGQLGRALASVLADHGPVVLDHGNLDVADGPAVEQRIAALRPEAVFNTAAFNRVDDAEEQAEEAFRTNA